MATNSKSEEIADRLVESGRFASRREALDEAARLMKTREQILEETWKGIEEGLADAAAGRVFSAEEVEAELRATFARRG